MRKLNIIGISALSESELTITNGGSSEVGRWFIDSIGSGLCKLKKAVISISQTLGSIMSEHGDNIAHPGSTFG